MAQQGTVTKIYSLKTAGFDIIHNQFKTLSDDLARIKKLIIDLQGQKLTAVGKDLDTVNKTIVEASGVQEILEQKIAAVNAQSDVSVGRFAKLSTAYKEAEKNSNDMAAAYGVESVEAKKAQAAAAALKDQLVAIKDFTRTGATGVAPAPVAPIVPFTTNLDALAAEQAAIEKTGVVVNQLEQDELQASLAASEWAQSNKVATDQVAAASQEVVGIKTKYEQFTGSLRQNFIAFTENSEALRINKAQQKELQTAIIANGTATEGQIEKMALLKQEQGFLNEANRELAVTTRSQIQESYNDGAAKKQLAAQLGQLQQAYFSLTEIERASPIGQELSAEIDILLPKVKELEYEVGVFGRNVGNYPQLFGGAFKVLEKELDVVKGKLVTGNFGTNQFSTLTAQEQVLKNVTQTLGAEFTSTAAKASAFKEAGRQLAATFGTQSKIFKDFSAQVALTNVELKKQDQQLTATGNTGRSVFKSMYGTLRQLANAIPGIGISGIILALITPIQAFASELFKSGSAVKYVSDNFKILREVQGEAVKSTAQELVELNGLVAVARDENLTRQQRNNAITELQKKYPDYLRNITLEKINSQEAKTAIDELTQSIFQKAVADEYAKRAADEIIKNNDILKKLDEETIKINKNRLEYQRQLYNARKTGDKQLEATLLRTGRMEDQLIITQHNLGEELGNSNIKLKDLTDGYEKALAAAEKFARTTKPTKTPGSKISVEEGEGFKNIDAIRDLALAKENIRTNEILKLRNLTFDEEVEHLKTLEKINIDALNAKIFILNQHKKLNAEELATREKFGEQITSIELDTSKKINDIEKKRFDDNLSDIKNQLAGELDQIDENNRIIQEDVSKTNVERGQAQLDADNKRIEAQKRFYAKLLALSSDYNKEVLFKAKEDINKAQQVYEKDNKGQLDRQLKDVEDRFAITIDKIKADAATAVIVLLSANKTATETGKGLADIKREATLQLEELEIQRQKTELDIIKDGVDKKLKTEKEYQDALTKLREAEQKHAEDTLGKELSVFERFSKALSDFGKGFLQNILQIKRYTKEEIETGIDVRDALAQSYHDLDQAISEAYQGYFRNEAAKIDHENQVLTERLDNETKLKEARAQSQAEIDTIDKEAALKKKALDKQASDEKKKLALKQLAIDFALAVIKSIGQYGLPLALIPIAAETALYAIQRGNIQKQQFAFGGQPGEVPVHGGAFGGRTHSAGGTDFSFKGKNYNAEVAELAVIRTRNAPKNQKLTVSGTQGQIASALNVIGGGRNFLSGATVQKFDRGGYFGERLQPPVFTAKPSTVINNGGISEAKFDELTSGLKEAINAINGRIDRIEVIQVTKTVTDAQRKAVQQSGIASFGSKK